ncbi:MAG: hypothetical protein C4288_17940 [Leptolyngbya sp. ERB_1_1]
MIIADLSYQEVATDISDLEGGMAASISVSQYTQKAFSFQTSSTAGTNGSATSTSLQSLEISSSSLSAVLLDADSGTVNNLIKGILSSFL